MRPQPEKHFFIGKGGVGKSTTSALTAIFLADAGKNTLLVSMDPAHNQRDLFETAFSEKPKKVLRNLAVREIDSDDWIGKTLKETRENIRKTYLYESAFNLQDHFKVLQFSPGLEEHALLSAFEDILHREKKRDAVIFDMAPTALTLRFFSLPSVTLLWLEKLLELRNLICRKKEIVSRIRLGPCELETDRVKERLHRLLARHRRLRDELMGESTRVHLVMNSDRLSLSEAVRIHRRLADIGIGIDRLVVNKVCCEDPAPDLPEALAGKRVARFPAAPGGLLGLEAMRRYVGVHPDAFREPLSPR